MLSDTPRTDQVDVDLRGTYYPHAFGPTYVAMIENSRDLERATNALRETVLKLEGEAKEANAMRADAERLKRDRDVSDLAVDIETELCAEVAANTENDFPEAADEPRTGAHVGDYWNGFRAACEEIAFRIRLRNADADLPIEAAEVEALDIPAFLRKFPD